MFRLPFCFGILFSLLPLPLVGQFILNGDAVQTDNNCYRLTEPVNWASGSIWNPDKISLNESFEVVMDIYLGCKDSDGADGIVFGFQPVSTSIGAQGEGIGFQGIVPSFGIEFDSWQNLNLNDPTFDHLAVIRNGNLNHATANTLAGPIQASATSPNVEDCRFHSLRVSWDAEATQLSVYFDCELRITYIGDIVNEIFNGEPEVFWGFTSATGAANNLHQVCFSYTSFLDRIPDVVMCPGGQVQLQATGGSSYSWSPAEGLSDPNIANPVASPTQTTNYTVEVRDICGIPFYDEVEVEVAGDSVFFDLGADTTACADEPLILDASSTNATYAWSNGSSQPTLTVKEPGTYAVTVTKTDTACIADDRVTVDIIPVPQVELGEDTILCEGQSIILQSSFKEGELSWQDGSTADTFRVNRSGIYELTARNSCGTSTDAIAVNIESCREAYLPNAFSPNGDGSNDHFYVMDGGDVESVRLFRIFDRWGNLVFEAKNIPANEPAAGWNGEYRNKPLNPGVFAYYAELLFRDGTTELREGDVTLLR